MAKITLENGMVIEGAIEEFMQMGVKFPVEEEAKVEPLKVGDYVKVVAAESEVAENGDVFEITHTNYGGVTVFPFNGKRVTDGRVEQFYDREIIRATNGEVSKAKHQGELKAVAKKWAEIGRKPNEFKEGDIVRVKRNRPCIANLLEGEIGEITQYDWNDSFNVTNKKACFVGSSDVELITPVEARFDR
jgi:sRNA-binding regulator protein Hfq